MILLLQGGNESDMRMDASFGLFLSQPGQVLCRNICNQFPANQSLRSLILQENAANSKTDRTFYITGGYNFVFPNNPLFEIEPSVFILSDLASTQYNFTAIVKYNDKFWGGLNYRFQESVGVIVGMRV